MRIESSYLATTGISDVWDKDCNLLLLGPWCLTEEKSKQFVQDKKYCIIDYPWKPAFKIKEAAGYCYEVYQDLLLQLSENLNSIHGVSYGKEYWQVLIGVWLLSFISAFYDRYRRIEYALEQFPDLYTSALSREKCKLVSLNTYDAIDCKLYDDYYNLKLFSLIAYSLLPKQTRVCDLDVASKIQVRKYSWERKLYYSVLRKLDLFSKGDIVLSEMYHLNPLNVLLLKCKSNLVRFLDFNIFEKYDYNVSQPTELRKRIILHSAVDKFRLLLNQIIPDAIPMCYLENYQSYKAGSNVTGTVRFIGSAIGWYYNEGFKFFAANALLRGAKLIDFQCGGDYGFISPFVYEKFSLERDIFYTWGWDIKDSLKTKPLPSAHLSKLKDTYIAGRSSKILFVSTTTPKYRVFFNGILTPEDMPKYFEDKKIFLLHLDKKVRDNLLYRRHPCELGWEESEYIRSLNLNFKFITKGRLVSWFRKAKLVVIDHPGTSLLEVLTINVPCVLYWDHSIFLIREEAKEYFNLLAGADILYRDPVAAVTKVNKIYDNPLDWWLTDEVQNARIKFCERYAYARKDWMKIWTQEFKYLQGNAKRANEKSY